jgi:hypothetical protein
MRDKQRDERDRLPHELPHRARQQRPLPQRDHTGGVPSHVRSHPLLRPDRDGQVQRGFRRWGDRCEQRVRRYMCCTAPAVWARRSRRWSLHGDTTAGLAWCSGWTDDARTLLCAASRVAQAGSYGLVCTARQYCLADHGSVLVTTTRRVGLEQLGELQQLGKVAGAQGQAIFTSWYKKKHGKPRPRVSGCRSIMLTRQL